MAEEEVTPQKAAEMIQDMRTRAHPSDGDGMPLDPEAVEWVQRGYDGGMSRETCEDYFNVPRPSGSTLKGVLAQRDITPYDVDRAIDHVYAGGDPPHVELEKEIAEANAEEGDAPDHSNEELAGEVDNLFDIDGHGKVCSLNQLAVAD